MQNQCLWELSAGSPAVRITLCYCHFRDTVILICAFFIFCINMIQVKSCIAEYADCHDQYKSENIISCCFFLLLFLVFPAHNHSPLICQDCLVSVFIINTPLFSCNRFVFIIILYRKKTASEWASEAACKIYSISELLLFFRPVLFL